MLYRQDPHRLEIYHEGRKRKILVAHLFHDTESDRFKLEYEPQYLSSKKAIALGPELTLQTKNHQSDTCELFPSLLDRIPSKKNPAYAEYCQQQGIAVDEANPIILLTTLGRKGSSTFIIEPVYQLIEDIPALLSKFRDALQLSRWDIAMFFDMPELTLLKVEKGRCQDKNILRLIGLYMVDARVALQQLDLTGKRLPLATRCKLYEYFKGEIVGQ